MLHLGGFNIRTDLFVLIAAVFVLLIQLLMCFKVKPFYIRILPAMLFSGVSAIFLLMAAISEDWDAFGFIFLSICSAALLLPCAIAWAIWKVIEKIKRK